MAIAETKLSLAQARVEAEYRRRTPTSASLHTAARQVLPGGDSRNVAFFPPYPVFIQHGAGCRMTDVDGNLYLDFLSNYTSQIHGHGHPFITEAAAGQIAQGTVYGAPVEAQVRLAEALCARLPSVERIRFCNSGTEATLMAIRAALASTGRSTVLKMEGGYHGSHDAAMVSFAPSLDEAGPIEAPRSVPASLGLFRGMVADVVAAPFNNLEATAKIIERHADDLAAVIVEPVLGGAGVIPARPEYLRFLRAATASCGALLIFDEVITFRLAYGGAQELYGVSPDLTALGKVIGGGFPVGAFGGRAEVMEIFDPRLGKVHHSGTFNANPVTMAAGLAALELLTREEIARLNDLGERLRRGFGDALAEAGIRWQVTGAGSLLCLHYTAEPVTDYRSAATSSPELKRLTHLSLLNRGVFIGPRGYFCISTPMSARAVDEAVSVLTQVLAELSALSILAG